MSDLNLDRLEALAENAQPFVRHGGIDPATVTIPAADLLALVRRTRKFANMLGNNAKALNDVLPREVLRQKAAAWDEGRDATLDKVTRFYGLQPHEALFLTNKTPNPYRCGADGTEEADR